MRRFFLKLSPSSHIIIMIQLFDYVGLVFSNKEKEWEKLKDSDKARNFFMLNRFLSIKYPVQVHHLSLLRINPSSASDYWHHTMKGLFGSTPKWIYAKTKKKNEEAKKLDLPSEEMIKWYCEKNEISRKEFLLHVKFFGDNFLSEVKSMEKVLKSQGVLS